MKRKTLAALLLCGASLIAAPMANAQGEPPPPPEAGGPPPHPHGPRPNITEMLTRSLSLNDAQKAQVKVLAEAIQPQLDAIRKQARESETALIKTLNDQIRPLLTPEQQSKLDAVEALRPPKPPGPPPQ